MSENLFGKFKINRIKQNAEDLKVTLKKRSSGNTNSTRQDSHSIKHKRLKGLETSPTNLSGGISA